MFIFISQFITLSLKIVWFSQPQWQSRLANSSVRTCGCRRCRRCSPLGLPEMLLQAECWPPLTLVRKAWRVKRRLRCHIWPGGEVIQNCPPPPSSTPRPPPTELVSRIPRGNLPTCFFLSSLTRKQQMSHAKPKIAGVTPFDFILLFLLFASGKLGGG